MSEDRISAALAGPDGSKTERVYTELRRRIRELELPPGALIRKESIAMELGVSRAPVSEAISRLADEALVDVFPQHGSFVAAIRAEDVREALFIRTALEVEAVRRVAQDPPADLLADLEANLSEQRWALERDDLPTFYDLDEALHFTIFRALGSPRALRLLEVSRAPLDRPRRIALPEPGRGEGTFQEHRRLVDAIGSGDPELAMAAMRAHLNMVAQTVERQLTQVHVAAG
jgi:DNA-binding GntR family transcriptional regulator